MTTKQTIEVEGLPQGWKLTKIKIPDGCTEKAGMNTISSHNIIGALFDLEKIQPRRIVIEETEEDNLKYGVNNSWCNQHFCNGLILSQQPKRWREVKGTGISLTNEEPKLSLSVEECSTLLANAFGVCNVWEKIREFLKDK